jgi:hypothetical protein
MRSFKIDFKTSMFYKHWQYIDYINSSNQLFIEQIHLEPIAQGLIFSSCSASAV